MVADVLFALTVVVACEEDPFAVEYVGVADVAAFSDEADAISLSISLYWFCITCSAACFSSSS